MAESKSNTWTELQDLQADRQAQAARRNNDKYMFSDDNILKADQDEDQEVLDAND